MAMPDDKPAPDEDYGHPERHAEDLDDAATLGGKRIKSSLDGEGVVDEPQEATTDDLRIPSTDPVESVDIPEPPDVPGIDLPDLEIPADLEVPEPPSADELKLPEDSEGPEGEPLEDEAPTGEEIAPLDPTSVPEEDLEIPDPELEPFDLSELLYDDRIDLSGAGDIDLFTGPLAQLDPLVNPVPEEQEPLLGISSSEVIQPLPEIEPAPVGPAVSMDYIPSILPRYIEMPIGKWDTKSAEDLVVGELEDRKDALEGFVDDIISVITDGGLESPPSPRDVFIGYDSADPPNLVIYMILEMHSASKVFQAGFPNTLSDIGVFQVSYESMGFSGGGTADMLAIPLYNGFRATGSTCDEDTFEAVPDIVGDAEVSEEYPYGKYPDADPLEIPDPDDDTEFNEAGVADVKVSDGDTSCIKKMEFQNKKLLQNKCNNTLLQEDAEAGQNDDVYGFADDFSKPPQTLTASMDGTTLEFECGVLVDKDTTGGGTSCDEDTYAIVEATDDPNTLPDADDDTDFDSGSVADVKVSTPYGCFGPAGAPLPFFNEEDCLEEEYAGEPVNSWGEASCVRKIEFQNKKLLQNECNKVVLQEDASGGQAEAVFGLDAAPIFVPLWEISWDSDPDKQFHLQQIPESTDYDTFLGCMVVMPPTDSGEVGVSPFRVNPCCDYS